MTLERPEQLSVEREDKEESPRKNFEAFFTRHGVALYREHLRTLTSDDPEQRMNPDMALRPDLDPEHIESARHAAAELIGSLNPETDEICIVSSNLPRAIETANIYREVAHEKGFTVVHHEDKARNEYARESADDEIRILKNLNVEVENLVTLSVFHPDVESQGINWEKVSDDTKSKWAEARVIIESDDRGNWGKNFVAHAEAISQLFPDVGRAKEAYERQFQNLIKLGRFAAAHSAARDGDKQIKVLAFGHENYIRPFLKEYYGDPELNNVETIKVEIGDEVSVERRGEVRKIN